MLLPAADEGGVGVVRQSFRLQPEPEKTGTLRQAPEAAAGGAQEVPGIRQPLPVEGVEAGYRRERMGRQVRSGHNGFHNAFAGVDHRPAGLPFYRHQEGFPAQIAEVAAVGAGGQTNHPPVAVLGIEDIRMSHIDYGRLPAQMPVGQNGVALVSFIRAIYMLAPGDSHGMGESGSPFGDHQVVVAPDFVQMGAFLGMGHLQGALPQAPFFPHQLAGGHIQLGNPDVHILGMDLALRRNTVAGIIDLPVIVEQKGRVNARRVLQPYRIGPGACGILRCNIKIMLHAFVIDEGGDHVEGALMVADGRRPNGLGRQDAVHIQLGGPVQHMAQLPPMNQIPAVEYRNAREIFEAGGHQIIVFSHPAYGRVRVETRQNRILVSRHHFILPA
ncbi:hypothetical protein D3C75_727250 [compost metagenome]